MNIDFPPPGIHGLAWKMWHFPSRGDYLSTDVPQHISICHVEYWLLEYCYAVDKNVKLTIIISYNAYECLRRNIHVPFYSKIRIDHIKHRKQMLQNLYHRFDTCDMQVGITHGWAALRPIDLLGMGYLLTICFILNPDISWWCSFSCDFYRALLLHRRRCDEEVATGLALQTMDLDVHRRKWTLTIHGLKGEAVEDEEVTRDASVKLAQDHLGIPDAASTDFATCHRLSKYASSGIILRFRELSTRNTWPGNAKELRHHFDAISISPTPRTATIEKGTVNQA